MASCGASFGRRRGAQRQEGTRRRPASSDGPLRSDRDACRARASCASVGPPAPPACALQAERQLRKAGRGHAADGARSLDSARKRASEAPLASLRAPKRRLRMTGGGSGSRVPGSGQAATARRAGRRLAGKALGTTAQHAGASRSRRFRRRSSRRRCRWRRSSQAREPRRARRFAARRPTSRGRAFFRGR